MGFYDRVIFPRLMHFSMGLGRFTEYRRRIVPAATGRVLEIGIGSGLNLPLYGAAAVEVVGIDPNATLNRMAEQRASRAAMPVRLINGSAENLPFDAASFDSVVTTWTLCSIADAGRALAEMRRVLKPGGQLLFFEHGAAPDANIARWQDRLTPLWQRCAGGCRLNRPIDRMIRDAGFTLGGLETGYLDGPRMLTFFYWGRATP